MKIENVYQEDGVIFMEVQGLTMPIYLENHISSRAMLRKFEEETNEEETSISSLLEEKHGLCQHCLDASEITIDSSLEEMEEEGLKGYKCLLLKELKEVEAEL